MKTKWYIIIWRDGKFFDLWHVNHLLAGILLGQFFFHFQRLWLGFAISLILMTAWEIFEVVKKITETTFNKSVDMITGVVGFFMAYVLGGLLSGESYFILFIIFFIAWLTLEIWGYIVYKSGLLPPRVNG